MQYEYPITKTFNSWVLQWQIYEALGLAFDTNDVFSGMGWNSDTVIIYTMRELTPEEKQKLDDCMNNPTMGDLPDPTGYTIFEIKDVCDVGRLMQQTTGLKIKLINYIHVPPPKEGETDRLEIWVEGKLNTPQTNAIKNYYGTLITVKA